MEPKKNPKYDVHRQRGTIFQISLAITLALVITAFKWSVPIEKEAIADSGPAMTYSPIEDFIPSTTIKSDEPPKARELKPEKQIPIEFVPIKDELIVSSDPSTPTIDQGKPIDNSSPF